MSAHINQIPNPDMRGATLNLENGGSTSVSRVAGSGSAFVARITTPSAGAATTRVRLVDRAAASEGQSWFVFARVRADGDNTGPRTFRLRGLIYDTAPGATAGNVIGTQDNVIALDPNERNLIGLQIIAPAGAASVGLEVTRVSSTDSSPSDVWQIEQLFMIQSATVPPLVSTPNLSAVWYWTGAANDSTSYYPITVANLTVSNDMDPCPRVRIEHGAFLPGTMTATLWQQVGDTITAVAGAADVPSSPAGLVRVDYFAPFGVPVSYFAEMFDNQGRSLGMTPPATVTIGFVGTVITSPVDPRQSVQVELDGDAGEVLVEEFRGQVHQVGDRRILIASGGTGLDDLNLDFWTDTIEQYRAAVAVLKDAKGAIVFRSSYPMETPPVLYVWIPASKRTQTALPQGESSFKFENRAREVTPPSARVVFAVITYRRFKAFYPTYRDFRDAYATYRAAALNPPPEV